MGGSNSKGGDILKTIGDGFVNLGNNFVSGVVATANDVAKVCNWDDCANRSLRICKACPAGDILVPAIPDSCNRCNEYDAPTTCKRSSCPPGLRNDGLHCWDDLKTTCTGGIVTRNAPRTCREGYDFSPTDLTKLLCYEKCPPGYSNRPGDIVSCWNNKPTTKPINEKKPRGCRSNRDLVDGLCYQRCPDNTTRVPGAPTQCQGPRGLSHPVDLKIPHTEQLKSQVATCGNAEKVSGLCYASCQENKRVPGIPTQCMGKKGLHFLVNTEIPKTTWKGSREAGCKSNREKTQSACYTRCSDIYGECYESVPGIPTNCQPKRGLTYIPPVGDVPCPPGYIFDGVSACNNSYVPETYAKKSVYGSCPNGHDNINGSCYYNCPTIDGNKDSNGEPTKIQLGHIDGLPDQCGPPKDGKYPPSYTISGGPFYFPKTVPKVRKVAYSGKNDKGKVIT